MSPFQRRPTLLLLKGVNDEIFANLEGFRLNWRYE